MGNRVMTDGEWAEATAKAEALGTLMQALHGGGIALDAIARGEVPAAWDEIAESLAATPCAGSGSRSLIQAVQSGGLSSFG